jgi:hypothetical protein
MVTREEIKMRMLDDFASLYPRASSYCWSRFTKQIGLQITMSYEPGRDNIPQRLVMYNIDGAPLYRLDWSRNGYLHSTQKSHSSNR